MHWVINLHVGEVVYPLERLRSTGLNTRSWRTNWRAELNHSILGVHDLRGPFEYRQYGTDTACTVTIGDMVSLSHKFIVCYFRSCYPFFFI
jgi:hypothetical protein